jgi:hypothetical protein
VIHSAYLLLASNPLLYFLSLSIFDVTIFPYSFLHVFRSLSDFTCLLSSLLATCSPILYFSSSYLLVTIFFTCTYLRPSYFSLLLLCTCYLCLSSFTFYMYLLLYPGYRPYACTALLSYAYTATRYFLSTVAYNPYLFYLLSSFLSVSTCLRTCFFIPRLSIVRTYCLTVMLLCAITLSTYLRAY